MEEEAIKKLAGKRVLWVEDDKFLGNVIEKRLFEEGAEVIRSKTGAEALDSALIQKPHIILLDVLLPDIDGFEVLSQLKSLDKTKHIPVIMLTNLGQKEDKEKGLKLGAIKFMVKAMSSIEEIIDAIKEGLKI